MFVDITALRAGPARPAARAPAATPL